MQAPQFWTQGEYDRIYDQNDNDYYTQAELKSLLERAGTLLEVYHITPNDSILRFDNAPISVYTDSRHSGMVAEEKMDEHGKLVEYKIIFTHPDEMVKAWIYSDTWYGYTGGESKIYRILVLPSPAFGNDPVFDSDTDDDQYERDLNLFAESEWSRLRSDNPLVVTFRLPQ